MAETTHILTVTDNLVSLECTAGEDADCRPRTLLGAPTPCQWTLLDPGELMDAALDKLDRMGCGPGTYRLRNCWRETDGFLVVHLETLQEDAP